MSTRAMPKSQIRSPSSSRRSSRTSKNLTRRSRTAHARSTTKHAAAASIKGFRRTCTNCGIKTAKRPRTPRSRCLSRQEQSWRMRAPKVQFLAAMTRTRLRQLDLQASHPAWRPSTACAAYAQGMAQISTSSRAVAPLSTKRYGSRRRMSTTGSGKTTCCRRSRSPTSSRTSRRACPRSHPTWRTRRLQWLRRRPMQPPTHREPSRRRENRPDRHTRRAATQSGSCAHRGARS
mmetsp:Transcript_50551/g.109614  ORF Transcript_50551/g.109614 Transcript_50551/m.109614 type:complete len:233 (-) Transcript_50551:200-898(-)